MRDPFDTMNNGGYFNPYIAGRDAARKEREQSKLREIEQAGNLSVIQQRLQKMRDFDEARNSRLAKYKYDESYYGAKAPLAGEEAGYDVSKKGLDNQTATFELRKKRNDLMKSMMPAIMRMRQTNPEAAAKLYNRLFGEKGLYGPGAGLVMDEAGAIGDPSMDPKQMNAVEMERQRRLTQAAGEGQRQKNWKSRKEWEQANENVTVIDAEGNPHMMRQADAEAYVAEAADGSRIVGKAGSYSPTTTARQEYSRAKTLSSNIQKEMKRLIPSDQAKISKPNVASLRESIDDWKRQAMNISEPNLRSQVEDSINRAERILPILERAASENLSLGEMLERMKKGKSGGQTSSGGFKLVQ